MAASSTTKQKSLIPPDPKQCQADKPNTNNFMTMGGISVNQKYIRGTALPTVIIHEIVAGRDGQKGAMSLCDDCLKVFKAQPERMPPVRVEPISG
jgi:hypothetical protein